MAKRDATRDRRDRWSRFWRWVCTHKIGETQIDPEARVDPAGFSEDEFPVVCSKCEYSLRGLPDGRCPECGTEFVRGRLLVEQYVLPQRLVQRGPGRRILLVAGLGSLALATISLVVKFTLVASLRRQATLPTPNISAIGSLLRSMLATALCVFFGVSALWIASVVILIRQARAGARKRRQILDAIEDAGRE